MKHLLFAVVIFLSACTTNREVRLVVTNPSSLARVGEVVEADGSVVSSRLGLKDGESFIVLNGDKKQIPYQITFDNKLLIEASVKANDSVAYTVLPGTPETFEPKVFGRFVPERKDDYVWENNMAAYRLYGPALKPVDGPSNGVDVWSKRTDKLIADKWYKLNAEGQDYHTDRGEGQDCYKVGRTLGAGMPAPVLNDTLVLGENFSQWELLDKGPLRTTARFTYNPLKVGDNAVTESRLISLDANTPFCRMTVTYAGAISPLTVAAGITLHAGEGTKELLEKQGAVLYWEKQEKDFGTIGTAVIMPLCAYQNAKELNNHLCAVGTIPVNGLLSYYFGAGWDKFLHPSLEAWRTAVIEQSVKVNEPLLITYR